MQTTKKKILYVITKSNFGGASRYVYELATSLPKDLFDVEVAVGGTGVLSDALKKAGIQTHSIVNFQRDINFWKEIMSTVELWRIVRTINPDIIHLNSSKAGGIGVVVARLAGVKKIIFTAHGWPFHEKRNWIWKTCVWILSWITGLLAHTVILVSEYDRKNMWMPFVKKKCLVIHTALPRIDFFSREASRRILFTQDVIDAHTHDLWLATIAECTPNKNLLFAIKSVTDFNKNNPQQKIFYTVLGDGELLQEFREYIQTHRLENEIHLSGYIPDARIYLKAFDIFLLPSIKEGMPYAILEACSAGLPIIASNVGGIPEIITHEKNGLLFPRGDTEMLSKYYMQLIENPDQRKSLAQNALLRSQDFTFEKMLKKTTALYTSTQ